MAAHIIYLLMFRLFDFMHRRRLVDVVCLLVDAATFIKLILNYVFVFLLLCTVSYYILPGQGVRTSQTNLAVLSAVLFFEHMEVLRTASLK